MIHSSLDGLISTALGQLVGQQFCPGSSIRHVMVRGNPYAEIINANVGLTNPRHRFSSHVQEEYLAWQIAWYATGKQDHRLAAMLPQWATTPTMKADGEPDVNSNYGQYVWEERQIDHCINLLREDPHSRRAIIFFNRPSVSMSQTSDHICTTSLQFLTDDAGDLAVVVTMRSNELFWSLPLDIGFFTLLQEIVAAELGRKCGPYYHNVGSLHAKGHVWALKETYKQLPILSYTKKEWPPIARFDGHRVLDEIRQLRHFFNDPDQCPEFQTDLARHIQSILTASKLRPS